MRTDKWLEETLYNLWDNNFVDIPRTNVVLITFGKRSKRQLGCIKHLKRPNTKKIGVKAIDYGIADDKTISLITISAYFKDENIPDYIIRSTIAHELCHYAHGFSSPLPRMFNHPHKGGVIRKELFKRGLSNDYKISQKWIKANWLNYLKRYSVARIL